MCKARVVIVGVLLSSSVLPSRSAAAQGARAESPSGSGSGSAVPLALSRHHHTVWPLGEVAPLGRQASLLQSPDGYLWLESRAGIVRFDGVRFSVLTGRDAPALQSGGPGLRNFGLRAIDRDGEMWLARPDGALLSYARGRFRVRLDPHPGGFRYVGPVSDGAGDLWVMIDSAGEYSAGGKLVNGQVERDAWPAGAPRTGIRYIVADTGDGMWVGTVSDGVWHVTPRGSRRYRLPPEFAGAPGDQAALPILHARDGALWVQSSGGLMRMHEGGWERVRVPGGVEPVNGTSAVEAPDGTVYLAARGEGVLRWSAGRVEHLLPRDRGGQVVYDVMLDAEGALWASTDAGLERFRPAPFAQVVRADGEAGGQTFELVADDEGRLWVSDYANGLYYVDGADRRRSGEGLAMTAAPLPARVAKKFRMLGGGRRGVWIAPDQGGLALVTTGGVAAYGSGAGLPPERMARGHVDATGALWLTLFPTGAGRFQDGRFGVVSVADDELTVRGAFGVGFEKRSILFSDLRRPAAYVADVRGAFRRLDHETPLAHVMSEFAIEGRDTVWGLVFNLPGLARIANGRATSLPFSAPLYALPGFNPRFVVAGGWLWFASSSGIGRFNLAALHRAADAGTTAPAPQLFGALDGVPMPRLSDYGGERLALAPDDRLWMSTPSGLAVVDPDSVPSNAVAPAVHVEEVIVDGRMLTSADRTDVLARVAANPGRVDIRFTALGLRMPERVRVEYRLDGVDPDWRAGTGPRIATYTQLRPGHYQFRVRAWNEDGVPSTGEATLALHVLPAWYQAWWAGTLGLLAVGGAGAAGAAAVAAARRRRADAAALATVAERARVARELHDTLLGDLAGIAMQLEAVAVQVELATQSTTPSALNTDAVSRGVADAGRAGAQRDALRVIRELRDQARRSLDDARDAVTAMRRTSVDDVPLWAQLGDTARRVFAGTDVDVRVTHGGPALPCKPDVQAELLRIATEAVTNARKHAGCRTLTVSCVTGGDDLRIRVHDDGSGFDPADGAAEGHWGLVGMRERAAAIGASLTVDSAPGRGTTVQIVIGTDHVASR